MHAVSKEPAAQRVRRRKVRTGFGEIKVDTYFPSICAFHLISPALSIFEHNSQVHNRNTKHSRPKTNRLVY